MSRRLENKTAIVTGASRGIGLAIAQRLVAEGARVVITGRKPGPLARAVEILGGPEVALGVAGHADHLDHQVEVVHRSIATFGGADLLVNNTAINPTFGPLMEIDLNVARRVVDTNCIAALSWTQQVHRDWQAENGGAIVNVASVTGLRPASGIAFYAASKAMLIHLTQELAVELGPTVRVNSVAPAVVKTRFAEALYDGREHDLAAAYPLQRLGVPEDVGGAVAFLLGPDASWITGHTLVVDGGKLLTGGV